MSKVHASLKCYAPIREDGSATIVSYEQQPLGDGTATWQEVTIWKTQRRHPSLQEVKEAVLADINAQTRAQIVSGMTWQEKPVWLSEENQLNLATAKAPATFKLGETEDGQPVYHTFETQQDIDAFNEAAAQWRQQCLAEGYRRKDAIDWAPYEACYPKSNP